MALLLFRPEGCVGHAECVHALLKIAARYLTAHLHALAADMCRHGRFSAGQQSGDESACQLNSCKQGRQCQRGVQMAVTGIVMTAHIM